MRILAVLDSDLFVRNFVSSGAFDELLKDKEFKICISDKVSKLKSSIPPAKLLGYYKQVDHNSKLVDYFRHISMRVFSKKSSTLAIKVKASTKGLKYYLYNLFSLPFLYSFSKWYILKNFKNNKSLDKIVKKNKPEILIFPFTGFESSAVELATLSRKYNFKTFFLVDGWDNLSSKGVFLLKPDYLGVWGQQSLIDGTEIQGMDGFSCFMLGCARYDTYFKNLNALTPFSFKYILFAGASTANDEITPLKIFDEILEKSRLNLKIVYRPHLWRLKGEHGIFDESEFRHVILDPQVKEEYDEMVSKGPKVYPDRIPSLDYYPGLLNNASFLISPMSSMVLEAAIYNVPSLVLAHDDGINKLPPSSQAKYRHFYGAEEVPGWFFAHDKKEIKILFEKMLKRFAKENPKRRSFKGILSKAIKKYLFYDENIYRDRLMDAVNVIESIIKEKKKLFPLCKEEECRIKYMSKLKW